ncbi:MAG: hypothetical protein ABIH25_04490, partial [Candidatus Woesearchaeota archaeon]
MKRGIALFQINLLIISIFAFCFILNISFISAKDEWINVDGVTKKLTPELSKQYPKLKPYSSIESA